MAGENFGFSLGVGRRLVDEIAGLAHSKRRLLDTGTLGDRGAQQFEDWGKMRVDSPPGNPNATP